MRSRRRELNTIRAQEARRVKLVGLKYILGDLNPDVTDDLQKLKEYENKADNLNKQIGKLEETRQNILKLANRYREKGRAEIPLVWDYQYLDYEFNQKALGLLHQVLVSADMNYSKLMKGLKDRGLIDEKFKPGNLIGIFQEEGQESDWPEILIYIAVDEDGRLYYQETLPYESDSAVPTELMKLGAKFVKTHYDLPFNIRESPSGEDEFVEPEGEEEEFVIHKPAGWRRRSESDDE